MVWGVFSVAVGFATAGTFIASLEGLRGSVTPYCAARLLVPGEAGVPDICFDIYIFLCFSGLATVP